MLSVKATPTSSCCRSHCDFFFSPPVCCTFGKMKRGKETGLVDTCSALLLHCGKGPRCAWWNHKSTQLIEQPLFLFFWQSYEPAPIQNRSRLDQVCCSLKKYCISWCVHDCGWESVLMCWLECVCVCSLSQCSVYEFVASKCKHCFKLNWTWCNFFARQHLAQVHLTSILDNGVLTILFFKLPFEKFLWF